MAKKKTGLGRGLSTILHDNTDTALSSEPKSAARALNFKEINVSEIETNPYQPRIDFEENALQELADSIRVQGIIQPITVRRLSANEYQLISGERRFRASQMAGLTSIPSYIKDVDNQQMIEMALIENIQRADLNAMEVSLSYQRLLEECDLKQEELGERVGKARSTVNNYLRLLKLPPEIQRGIQEEYITMGHAKSLLGIDQIEVQLAVFEKIISEDLSVRKTEEIVRDFGKEKIGTANQKTPQSDHSPEAKRLQADLSSHFGTKVKVALNANDKGEIKIPFVSIDDLNRLLEILKV